MLIIKLQGCRYFCSVIEWLQVDHGSHGVALLPTKIIYKSIYACTFKSKTISAGNSFAKFNNRCPAIRRRLRCR